MSGDDGRLTLTVSELNEAVKTLLESDLRFRNLCIEGELSNYKVYPSGHHYFTLKDQESSLKCVMFRSSAIKLRFRPENGMRVFVSGSLRVYPKYWSFSFSIGPSKEHPGLISFRMDWLDLLAVQGHSKQQS